MQKRSASRWNGVEVHPQPRRRLPTEPPPKRSRIFEHLEGTGEDEYFSKIAHEMHAERWWTGVPVVVPPYDVSGEIECR